MATSEASRDNPHKRATLADIAAAVDLHISTVSRVLNDDPGLSIRPETRDRILHAAQVRAYRPNAMARALKRSRTGAFAMVVPLLRNSIWSAIEGGALRYAREHGQVVLLIEEPEDEPRPASHYQYLVEESRVDGLVIATALRSSAKRRQVPTVPHVYMNRRGPRPGNDVVMDEERAMGLFVEHLKELGHHRIAVVDGHTQIDTVYRRRAAVKGLCAAQGMTAVFEHEEHTEEGGYLATRRLLSRTRRPTAIGVGSLNQVFGAFKALREAGASVPGDVSLVSFDEDECLAYLEVPVTSVSMPLESLGAAAVRALMDRVERGTGTDVMVSEPLRLIQRESTTHLPR